MQTIHKYVVPITDEVSVPLPFGAQILHLDVQRGAPCIWALVDDQAPLITWRFAWRGTGHDCTGLVGSKHLGTVLVAADALVFHLFRID